MNLRASPSQSGGRARAEEDAHALRASAALLLRPDAEESPVVVYAVIFAAPPGFLHAGEECPSLLEHVRELVNTSVSLQSSTVLREDRERWHLPPSHTHDVREVRGEWGPNWLGPLHPLCFSGTAVTDGSADAR